MPMLSAHGGDGREGGTTLAWVVTRIPITRHNSHTLFQSHAHRLPAPPPLLPPVPVAISSHPAPSLRLPAATPRLWAGGIPQSSKCAREYFTPRAIQCIGPLAAFNGNSKDSDDSDVAGEIVPVAPTEEVGAWRWARWKANGTRCVRAAAGVHPFWSLSNTSGTSQLCLEPESTSTLPDTCRHV